MHPRAGPFPRSLDDAVNLGKQLRRVAAHSRDGGTMAIYRIFRERVFEPEAVISMAKAYEGVLVALRLTHRQDSITETVAKKIVEIAEMGERDPARLRDRALEEIRGNALPRTPGTAISDGSLDGEVKPQVKPGGDAYSGRS